MKWPLALPGSGQVVPEAVGAERPCEVSMATGLPSSEFARFKVVAIGWKYTKSLLSSGQEFSVPPVSVP